MPFKNLLLHPKAVGSLYGDGYAVLQLETGRQFLFVREQRSWFEALKQAKRTGDVLGSLPTPRREAEIFLRWLIEARLLEDTCDQATGEIPPWHGELITEAERRGRGLASVKREEWQAGFAFADSTASSMAC